ncbi:MAG TPA: hypothetical protein PKM21_08145 [Anaerolineales bacterium]|nr:hypothetical protein [Anaerolineales bacterium]
MSLHYDEKGKFFTDYVTKEPVDTIIQTSLHTIYGRIYVRADERVSDLLNRSEPFLAVTDVQIKNAAGEVLFESEFLAINRQEIIWIIPKDERDTTLEEGNL